MHFSSVQTNFWVAHHDMLKSRWKRPWIPSKFFSIHLLRALCATKCSFCASVSPCRSPHDVVRDWDSIQSPLVKMSAGFIFSQEMSTSSTDCSLVPKRKHSEHCTFGIVSHNSNRSTLHISRNIFFDFSLNGLKASLCCRSAWSACRWGWLSIFFTSLRTRKFSLVSQLHVAIQTPWCRCLYVVWTNRWIVHFQRVSLF